MANSPIFPYTVYMRLRLKTKLTLLIIFIASILSTVANIISGSVINTLVDSHYRNKAIELARTVTFITDADAALKIKHDIANIYDVTEEKVFSDQWGTREFNNYVDKFAAITRNSVFKSLHNTLHAFQVANNVDSVYLLYIDPKEKAAVYMVDASDDPCPPGCIDSLTINEENLRIIDHPDIGFPSYITNTEEYGWLVTAGVPVYSGGKIICYAMVDISMADIRKQQRQFVFNLTIILLSLTVIICLISAFLVNYSLTRPLKSLSTAAAHYCSDESDGERNIFSNLDIHTRDEIEELADSMKKMESDLNDHIKNLLQTTRELKNTRQKANQMTRLAQKDALTGVRNKTGYLKEVQDIDDKIKNGYEKFGLAMIDMNFLKKINDLFGHEKGDAALINLCQNICTVFKHSPVFRIGGDEFVVILENNDFKNHEKLEATLKDMMNQNDEKGLALWQKASAAVGIALFDKETDTSVEDVFKRADKIMYENKKAMKAERT